MPEIKLKIETVDEAREAMDAVLVFLRGYRQDLKNDNAAGQRELSEAITLFETGCMWMIRSEFAEQGEYSPLLKLKPANE